MRESSVKQRLAAILAADVAGYSRLMAGGERATVAALDSARAAFREHIDANQGRVIDMAGDSVLAVFETATGAVAAALAVQKVLAAMAEDVAEDRKMRFRIGVHLGDIMEKTDGTVYGDGVNIAARLEGLAEPGGITVSDAVQGAVRGKVAAGFIDQGEQQVKNIPHPVRAFRVDAENSGPRTSAGQPELALPANASIAALPSIAVLPFANMSGDAEQEYFADGIVEDIITALSRMQSFFVIARHRTRPEPGPNLFIVLFAAETIRMLVGEADAAIEHFTRAMRVSPREPGMGALISGIGHAHLVAGRYEEALVAGQRATRESPNYVGGYGVMIRSLVSLGRLDEAKMLVPRLLELAPGLSISRYRSMNPFKDKAYRNRSAEGMRAAGVPE